MWFAILLAVASAQVPSECETELQKVLEKFYSLVGTDVYSRMAVNSGKWLGDLGNYFDCIDMSEAHYVLFEVVVSGTVIPFSLCGPKVCTADDYYLLLHQVNITSPAVRQMVMSFYDAQPSILRKRLQQTAGFEVGVFFPEHYIHEHFNTLDAGATAMVVLCSFLGLLMLAGTVLDLRKLYDTELQQKAKKALETSKEDYMMMKDLKVNDQSLSTPAVRRPSKFEQVLLCFSVYTNFKKLFASRSNEKLGTTKDPLDFLNAVRVMSMGWVILGHVYLLRVSMGSVKNLTDIPEEFKKPKTAMIYGALFSVDTFFWLSGFLMAFLLLQQLNTEKSVSGGGWAYLYFHRFYRILPAYAFVLFMCWAFTKYMGNGPLWMWGDKVNDHCHSWWWTNMVFLNNFLPDYEGNGCLGQSWYLANDMQFFWISPPLFFIYHKLSKVAGWVILGLLIALSIVSSAVIAHEKDYNVVVLANGNDTMNDDIYIKPYCRVGAYAIGIICGIVLFNRRYYAKTGNVSDALAYKIGNLLDNRTVRYAGYFLGIFLINFFIFIQYDAYKDVDNGWTKWNHAETLLFYGFQRPCWSLGISLIFLPLLLGHGKLVRWMMSLDLWTPLARLTFCTYLVHINLACVVFLSMNTAYWFDDLNIAVDFIFITVLSYGAAIPLTLAVESPFMALEKFFKH